jgi:dihydroorotate dehydrogenase (fumarate)
MLTKTKYLGLELKSPVIAGSCGLTANVDNLCKLEAAGAGAVVVKSVFEEQIIYDIKRNTHIMAPVGNYGESYEYIAQHVADDSLNKHFSMIREAKSKLTIPVIGSVNCYSYENWLTYAKRFEECGCDALELNMAILPYETSLSSDDVERTFNNIIQTLKKSISIPISIKVGPYFTDMAKFMQQLSWTGIQGITIFNKSLEVDIDIEKEELSNASVLSVPETLYNTLRWTAILSKKLRCDLSATTGVSKPEDIVKLLLAGANTIQVASSLYLHGVEYMKQLNQGLEEWMQKKGYTSIDQFRGKLAVKSNETASLAMRSQFMRYFAEIK